MLNVEVIRLDIEKKGYFFSSSYFLGEQEDLPTALLELTYALGTPNKGRNGQIVEGLTPKNKNKAHQNSLSCQYGKDALPFHIDMAHHQVPSRYLVFACSCAEWRVAPTFLLDISDLELTPDDTAALKTGVFLIKNGMRSFYANIQRPDVPFFRWDPGCMYPKDSIAAAMANTLSKLSENPAVRTINWSLGALLVVDNWRMLHARGKVLANHGERKLLRTTVQ